MKVSSSAIAGTMSMRFGANRIVMSQTFCDVASTFGIHCGAMQFASGQKHFGKLDNKN